MDLRKAIREQYHAGLRMTAECITRCPDDLWTAPNPAPGEPAWPPAGRAFWRIAFHSVYFTHLYLGQSLERTVPPEGTAVDAREEFAVMWRSPWELEPYELPAETVPCTQAELMEYLQFVDGLVDETVDGLDLDSPESGIPWYKNFDKLSHQLLNLRHVQGHVGQLSELLMLRGIDTDWCSRAQRAVD